MTTSVPTIETHTRNSAPTSHGHRWVIAEIDAGFTIVPPVDEKTIKRWRKKWHNEFSYAADWNDDLPSECEADMFDDASLRLRSSDKKSYCRAGVDSPETLLEIVKTTLRVTGIPFESVILSDVRCDGYAEDYTLPCDPSVLTDVEEGCGWNCIGFANDDFATVSTSSVYEPKPTLSFSSFPLERFDEFVAKVEAAGVQAAAWLEARKRAKETNGLTDSAKRTRYDLDNRSDSPDMGSDASESESESESEEESE